MSITTTGQTDWADRDPEEEAAAGQTLLESYFSEEELGLLDGITAAQVGAEFPADGKEKGNPYSKGMLAWLEARLAEAPSPMQKDAAQLAGECLEVASKLDEIDKRRLATATAANANLDPFDPAVEAPSLQTFLGRRYIRRALAGAFVI